MLVHKAELKNIKKESYVECQTREKIIMLDWKMYAMGKSPWENQKFLRQFVKTLDFLK